MAAISLGELTKIFLRAGNLTFGGGDPTVALLHKELVKDRRVITPQQYGMSFALARITPCTNVLAFSAAVAYLMRGWAGAVAAVTASSIPSAFVVLGATRVASGDDLSPLLKGVIQALVAVAVGLILSTVWSFVQPALLPGRRLRGLPLVAVSAAVTYFDILPPIAVLGLAALYGAFVEL